jgi:hypothetical protein
VDHHLEGAERVRVLTLQGGSQLKRLPRRIIQDDTEGIEAHHQLRAFVERIPHASRMTIAAVRDRHIAASQRKVLQCFACMHIADRHLQKL